MVQIKSTIFREHANRSKMLQKRLLKRRNNIILYISRTGEPAAVKVFNKGGASRDMYQQQRELQLVKKLEHKNLVNGILLF